MDNKSNKGIALIVTNSLFPEGDAESIRISSYAKIFASLGYEVEIISNKREEYGVWKQYNGFHYFCLKFTSTNTLVKGFGYLTHTYRLKKLLNNTYSNRRPHFILAADLKNDALAMIKEFTKKEQIPLFYDCVEWYSNEEFNGKENRTVREKTYQNECLLDKNVNIFAISTYLEEYFHTKGISCLRIPIIMDSKEYQASLPNNDKVRITYAGNPGGKDNLQMIFEALNQMNTSNQGKIHFDIVGVDYNTVNTIPGWNDNLESLCTFHGKLSRKDTISIVGESDFTILVRPMNARYARAGFPTKVVESLFCGTPVITTFSSDLGLYLKNDVNAICIKKYSENATLEAMNFALQLTQEERKMMRLHARKLAEERFDYHLYRDEVAQFLSNSANTRH